MTESTFKRIWAGRIKRKPTRRPCKVTHLTTWVERTRKSQAGIEYKYYDPIIISVNERNKRTDTGKDI